MAPTIVHGQDAPFGGSTDRDRQCDQLRGATDEIRPSSGNCSGAPEGGVFPDETGSVGAPPLAGEGPATSGSGSESGNDGSDGDIGTGGDEGGSGGDSDNGGHEGGSGGDTGGGSAEGGSGGDTGGDSAEGGSGEH